MKCWKNTAVGLRGISCLLAVGIWLGLCQSSYGEGTLAETTTAVGLQEQLAGGNSQTAPRQAAEKPKVDAGAERPDMAKFEKAAKMLVQAMQEGKYDQADFSAVWSTVVPKDANFSDSINAMCKPVFDQFGKPERLRDGRLTGANKAVFAVKFAKGIVNMTISLDQQDKIVEWTLGQTPMTSKPAAAEQTPKPPVPARRSEPQPAVQVASRDTNTSEISDFNAFQKELNRINIETKSEEQQWLGKLERKADLASAIEDLVSAELKFIRKLAESEHAEQTVKAVDLVLKQRQERLEKLEAKLQEELKQERQQQVERRKTTRTSGQEQLPRERPQRKTREAPANNAEGQQ